MTVKFYADKVTNALAGFEIVRGIMDEKSNSWGMLVKKGDVKYIVWIDMDEEGNGPGAISIDPERSEQ
jgi:hypothetical protein